MVLDLSFGKRAYDWLGAHPRIYRAIRWNVCFGREKQLQKRAIAAIGLNGGDTILDLACGAGVNLPHIIRQIGKTGKVVAVDYSEGMLNVARAAADSNGWTNVELLQSDAACLDLPARSLDGAICTFGLSAMPGEGAALRRIAAALKPGARFVALDAKTFNGAARIFNPLIGPFFKYTTNWDYKKDVIRSMEEVFGEIAVEEFHCGCNFIAVAAKR
jgi:ubiquinone/menaquinone biosynthesis C-methylase UbiE